MSTVRSSSSLSFENYQRNNLATHLTDTSINSLCEDLDPVRARLDIAEARGWRSVEIRGSAASKHEASAAKSFSLHYDLIAPGAFTAYIPARLHSAGAQDPLQPPHQRHGRADRQRRRRTGCRGPGHQPAHRLIRDLASNNAAGSDQISIASQGLAELAERLHAQVHHFNLGRS